MKTFIGLIGEWKKGYEGMHIAGRGQTDGIYVGNVDEQLTVWTLWNVQNCRGCTVFKNFICTLPLCHGTLCLFPLWGATLVLSRINERVSLSAMSTHRSLVILESREKEHWSNASVH